MWCTTEAPANMLSTALTYTTAVFVKPSVDDIAIPPVLRACFLS